MNLTIRCKIVSVFIVSFLLFIIVGFSGCDDKSTTSATTTTTVPAVQATIARELANSLNYTLEKYVKEVADGRSFLQEVKESENKVSIIYKNDDEKSKVYFDTGDKINKIFLDTPLRLFRDYEKVNSVDIKIGNKSFSVTRAKTIEYFKIDYANLKYKTEWQTFINSITDEKRTAYINSIK